MLHSRFDFFAEGDPKPQGSKKGFLRNNRVIMVEANPELPKWRNTVTLAARNRMMASNVKDSFQSAVSVYLVFWMPKPPSVKRVLPHVAPDLDKLVRAVFDAITAAEVWADDALVVEVTARKEYAVGRPTGVWVSIEETPPEKFQRG